MQINNLGVSLIGTDLGLEVRCTCCNEKLDTVQDRRTALRGAAQYEKHVCKDRFRLRHIRPWQLFTSLRANADDRVMKIAVPVHHGIGGLSMLETAVVLCAARMVEARRVFEFGTFLGSTTLNLALNVPEDGEVFTFDLDPQSAAELQQDPADEPITKLRLDQQRPLFQQSEYGRKVTQLLGESKHFDFSPWHGSMDCVFIDGGHDVETARADTENALKLIRRDKLSAILWHDYRNWDYVGLTRYLETLGTKLEIYHIEDTMLCAHFNDPSGQLKIA